MTAPERALFGSDAHGGAPDGSGSRSVGNCDWPAMQCVGHPPTAPEAVTAPERVTIVVHAGGDDLLPIHPTPGGEGVAVAFHVGGVTCDVCLALLDEIGRQLFGPAKDRHYRALEAGLDAIADPSQIKAEHARAVEAAVSAAVRVRITREITAALLRRVDKVGVNNSGIEAGLKAAFEAAGFEVEQ